MSLENIQANPELERLGYHLLPQRQLNLLTDAEALYEKGKRLRNAVGGPEDDVRGWELTIEAAHKGHPVAQADCWRFGRGTKADHARAVQMYRESTERGHVIGMSTMRLVCVQCSNVKRS